MPKQPIVLEPHSVLRDKAREIASAETKRLISNMKETLAAAPDGVGLAAPQIGVSLKVFLVSEEAEVIDGRRDADNRLHSDEARTKPQWKHYAFVNPVLKKQSRKKTLMTEGCLSIPGKFGEVSRAEKVFLEWQDENGKKHSRGFSGFFARVIQHEMDHLGGVLIIDRAKRMVDLKELRKSKIEAT